jgi:cell division protein FtsB
MTGRFTPGGATPQDPPAHGGAARPPVLPAPVRLTGRAALLAVVICAIALSLAYPVREYIAQRQQIDQLLAQQQTISEQVKALQEQNSKLSQTWYVEQQARDELHMCFPNEQCYEVVSGQPASTSQTAAAPVATDPWYSKLWASVRRADQEPTQ